MRIICKFPCNIRRGPAWTASGALRATITTDFENEKLVEAFTMALLVDKHLPRTLESLTYHEDLSARLRSLVRSSMPFLVPANQK